MGTQRKQPKEKASDQRTVYIQAPEGAYKQFVISIKQCLRLLGKVPPEKADKDTLKSMLIDFNKSMRAGRPHVVEIHKQSK